MTSLHITIEHKGDRRFIMNCDNFRREDATKEEIFEANEIEKLVMEAIKTRAEKIYSSSMVQSDE